MLCVGTFEGTATGGGPSKDLGLRIGEKQTRGTPESNLGTLRCMLDSMSMYVIHIFDGSEFFFLHANERSPRFSVPFVSMHISPTE